MKTENFGELLQAAIFLAENRPQVEQAVENTGFIGSLFMDAVCKAQTAIAENKVKLVVRLMNENPRLTPEQIILLVLDAQIAVGKITDRLSK